MTQSNDPNSPLDKAYQEHGRNWKQNAYCYPVISRRSGGLSIGVNLSPHKGCNFNCVYCQVDRDVKPKVLTVDLARLKTELEHLLDTAVDGSLFDQPPFDGIPQDQRVIRDIAFSGNGEPTLYPRFDEAVKIAADAKWIRHLDDVQLVLMTDAAFLNKPKVRSALRVLDENNGEIWAKLDAGTEAHFKTVNRADITLAEIVKNLIATARERPIIIQSLWMKLHDALPPDSEITAFVARLDEILAADGRIKLVQIYTVARSTAERFVSALSKPELDHIAETIKVGTDIPIETYYGVGG